MILLHVKQRKSGGVTSIRGIRFSYYYDLNNIRIVSDFKNCILKIENIFYRLKII